MPVKRRSDKSRGTVITPELWAFINDAELPLPEHSFKRFVLRHALNSRQVIPGWGYGIEDVWDEHGAEVTEDWINRHPGTRPRCWWAMTAPRIPVGTYAGWWCDGKLPQPRRRLQGTVAHPQAIDDGLWLWHTGCVPRGGTFESQAAYLRRHGLLTAGEMRQLAQLDFEPESIPAPVIELDEHGRSIGE